MATLYIRSAVEYFSDKMSGKKLINRPEDAVDEALEGKHITVTINKWTASRDLTYA